MSLMSLLSLLCLLCLLCHLYVWREESIYIFLYLCIFIFSYQYILISLYPNNLYLTKYLKRTHLLDISWPCLSSGPWMSNTIWCFIATPSAHPSDACCLFLPLAVILDCPFRLGRPGLVGFYDDHCRGAITDGANKVVHSLPSVITFWSRDRSLSMIKWMNW